MRDTNGPHTPLYFPEIATPWRDHLARFLQFCETVTIPSGHYRRIAARMLRRIDPGGPGNDSAGPHSLEENGDPFSPRA